MNKKHKRVYVEKYLTEDNKQIYFARIITLNDGRAKLSGLDSDDDLKAYLQVTFFLLLLCIKFSTLPNESGPYCLQPRVARCFVGVSFILKCGQTPTQLHTTVTCTMREKETEILSGLFPPKKMYLVLPQHFLPSPSLT